MPRRAAPGNRTAIEAALSPALRAALVELRELLDVGDWQDSPLGPPFQQAAVVLLAASFTRGSRTARLDRAATQLGLSHDTVRDRVRRWSGG